MRLQRLFSFWIAVLFVPISLIAQSEAFITTWKTDNPGSTNSTSIRIPTHGSHTYNYEIDWDNDGVYDQSNILENRDGLTTLGLSRIK